MIKDLVRNIQEGLKDWPLVIDLKDDCTLTASFLDPSFIRINFSVRFSDEYCFFYGDTMPDATITIQSIKYNFQPYMKSYKRYIKIKRIKRLKSTFNIYHYESYHNI